MLLRFKGRPAKGLLSCVQFCRTQQMMFCFFSTIRFCHPSKQDSYPGKHAETQQNTHHAWLLSWLNFPGVCFLHWPVHFEHQFLNLSRWATVGMCQHRGNPKMLVVLLVFFSANPKRGTLKFYLAPSKSMTRTGVSFLEGTLRLAVFVMEDLEENHMSFLCLLISAFLESP